MEEVKTQPLDLYPYPSLGVSYFAEQAYCEQRLDLWLQNPTDGLVSVPAQIAEEMPEAKRQEEIAASGTEFHEVVTRDARPMSWEEVKQLLRAGASLSLLEFSFKGSAGELRLIGRPDAVHFNGWQASHVFEYKVTDSNQLYTSHRVQLLLYGYLLEQQSFYVDDLLLVCVLVPRLNKSWITTLTSEQTQQFVDTIRAEATKLTLSQPSRRNWYHPGVKIGKDIQVKLRVFKYNREDAEREFKFFADYWLGRRAPMPTRNPNKCAVCLYNAIGLCPMAQVAYSRRF